MLNEQVSNKPKNQLLAELLMFRITGQTKTAETQNEKKFLAHVCELESELKEMTKVYLTNNEGAACFRF